MIIVRAVLCSLLPTAALALPSAGYSTTAGASSPSFAATSAQNGKLDEDAKARLREEWEARQRKPRAQDATGPGPANLGRVPAKGAGAIGPRDSVQGRQPIGRGSDAERAASGPAVQPAGDAQQARSASALRATGPRAKAPGPVQGKVAADVQADVQAVQAAKTGLPGHSLEASAKLPKPLSTPPSKPQGPTISPALGGHSTAVPLELVAPSPFLGRAGLGPLVDQVLASREAAPGGVDAVVKKGAGGKQGGQAEAAKPAKGKPKPAAVKGAETAAGAGSRAAEGDVRTEPAPEIDPGVRTTINEAQQSVSDKLASLGAADWQLAGHLEAVRVRLEEGLGTVPGGYDEAHASGFGPFGPSTEGLFESRLIGEEHSNVSLEDLHRVLQVASLGRLGTAVKPVVAPPPSFPKVQPGAKKNAKKPPKKTIKKSKGGRGGGGGGGGGKRRR